MKKVEGSKPADISKFVRQSIGDQSVSATVVAAVDRFFRAMTPGEVTTNALLVQWLEGEGIAITNSIKTDVAMAAVVRSDGYAKGQGSIERVKVNPSNKWSQWVYRKR